MERESTAKYKKKLASMGEYSNVAFAIEVFRNRLVHVRKRLARRKEGRNSREQTPATSLRESDRSVADAAAGAPAGANVRRHNPPPARPDASLPPLTADGAARAAARVAPRARRGASPRVAQGVQQGERGAQPGECASPARSVPAPTVAAAAECVALAGESTMGRNQEWARQMRSDARDQKRAMALNDLPSLPTAVPLAVPNHSARAKNGQTTWRNGRLTGRLSKRTSSPRRGAGAPASWGVVVPANRGASRDDAACASPILCRAFSAIEMHLPFMMMHLVCISCASVCISHSPPRKASLLTSLAWPCLAGLLAPLFSSRKDRQQDRDEKDTTDTGTSGGTTRETTRESASRENSRESHPDASSRQML